MQDYDYKNGSRYTLKDCKKVIGERASLTLTGTITEADTSRVGAYVSFVVDDRWGFGPFTLHMDLDAFEIIEGEDA